MCVCVPLSFHSHETLFEVAPEERRLVALDLPVLHRAPAQVFVQLGHVNGGGALLVHRGGLAQPVVDVSCLAPAPVLAYLRKKIRVCMRVGGRCARPRYHSAAILLTFKTM